MKDVPNIVKRRLQAGAQDATHPDPDLMTAFLERSLNPRERGNILEHLATCKACRDVAMLAIPELPDAVPVRSVPDRPSWFSWPVLRWGTLAACVVVVGAAVSLHYQSLQTGQRSSTVPASDIPVAQSKPAEAPPGLAPSNSVSAKLVAPSNEDRQKEAVVEMSEEKKKTARLDHAPSASGELAKQDSFKAREQLEADAGKKAMRSAAPRDLNSAPFSVDVAGAAPATASNQPVPGRAKDELEAVPAANTRMALAGGMMAKQAAPSSNLMARAPTVPVSVIPRWTLTSDGMLERSLDSGKTWETILVATPGIFRALTANGFDIWVGGAKGALYHSFDAGQHWVQVQPSTATESLSADVIGIEFRDLLHGTLTTSDKQSWITADAGRTWQRQ